jgi:hypothetical protein
VLDGAAVVAAQGAVERRDDAGCHVL